MAKKKTTKKAEDPAKAITGFLAESDIEVKPQVIKHLVNMTKKFSKSSKEVAETFAQKYKGASKSKQPEQTALVRTKRSLTRIRFKQSKDFLGIIVGRTNKITDLSGDRLKDAKKEYNQLLEKVETGEMDEDEFDALFIDQEEYEEKFKDYNKQIKSADKIEDVAEKTEKQNEARDMFELELEDRYLMNKVVLDDKGKPKLDENGNEVTELKFIDNMKVWTKSKSPNFDYGKLLESKPAMPFGAIVLNEDDPKFIQCNVKGKENIKKLQAAPMQVPVLMRIVDNGKQRWYTDAKFEINEEDTDEFGETQNDVYTTLIGYLTGSFPEKNQVSVDDIDAWEKKQTKNTGKTNHMVLVKGIVDSVEWKDDDSCTVVLAAEEEEFDMDEDDDDGDYLDEQKGVVIRLWVAPELSHMVDFDEDSLVYAFAEVYRGDFYDEEAKKTNPKKKALMPGGSVWGIFADPDEKTESDRGSEASEDDYDTEEEEDDDDDDDTDYIDDEEDEED